MAGNPGIFVRVLPSERAALEAEGKRLLAELPPDETSHLLRHDGTVNLSAVARHLWGRVLPVFRETPR